MTPEECVQALLEWTRYAVADDLKGSYAYIPSEKPQALPDVVIEVTRTAISNDTEALFNNFRIQQRMLVVHEAQLSFMVDNDDPEAAAKLLRKMAMLLQDKWLASATLGGRVPIRSPFIEFDYTTPFVEYEDGTKGREMTMTVAVGDLVEAD